MNLKQSIDVMTFLDSNTYPTGSTAYGLPYPEDHDRFCTAADFGKLYSLLRDAKIGLREETGYPTDNAKARTIKFELMGQCFHVFWVPDADIPVLQTVTDMVARAYHTFPEQLRQKPFRVFLFQMLRDFLSMTVKQQTVGAASNDVKFTSV